MSLKISETNRKREHIFLDSNDPSVPTLHDSVSSPPFIKLPFPPHIDPYKLISDRKTDSNMGRIPARTPNAFILYRKIFIESARKEGYHLPMTVISSMASKSWKHEPDIVKEEYRRISKQAFEIRKQLIPKHDRKKKRETWNFVSFSKKSNSNNSNKIEMKVSGKHQNNDIQQQKESVSSKPNLDTTNMFPPAESLSNVNNENDSYTKEQLPNPNYQMYDQKSLLNYNLANNSYISNNDNKDIGFDQINESLSRSNVTNIYDLNQQQLNINHDDAYTSSTIAPDSLMQNSHYNYYYDM